MDGLLQLGLTNAAWATVLALAAAVGTRWLKRYPALVHALWLMVLLKLATPSLVQFPLSWGNAQFREGAPASQTRTGLGRSFTHRMALRDFGRPSLLASQART